MRGWAWRPQGSPLPYDACCPFSVYGSGDPCGRHVISNSPAPRIWHL